MNSIYSTTSDISFQKSIQETHKTSQALVVSKASSLFEIRNQKLCNIAKKTFIPLSLGLGVATLPLNVIIHEWGHALADKFLNENCNPVINWKGLCLMDSYVSIDGCSFSLHSKIASDLAGPLIETIAVLAILCFSKSRYAHIALLPHIVHISANSLGPILGESGDYLSIYKVGLIPYSIVVAVSLTPLALSILQH